MIYLLYDKDCFINVEAFIWSWGNHECFFLVIQMVLDPQLKLCFEKILVKMNLELKHIVGRNWGRQ